ncbi:MAG: chlorophyllase [Candidatus Acidoferrum typicum]|nr:chlorophyllase [Candidatus Acidoferrum typicum]
MPRDYMGRRRIWRTVTNAVGVGVLGAVLAWAITRQPDAPAFFIRAAGQNTVPSASGKGSEVTGHSFGKYTLADGRYVLDEIADVPVHDTVRQADIHVRLLFPKISRKFPVIIFSPDDRDSRECCEALVHDWASHGYAIIQLARVAALPTEKQEKSVQAVGFKRDIRHRVSGAESGTRALNVTAVIDSLAALETRFPGIRGKLDAAHIGVAGDATGALAAEAIAGALLELPGQSRSNVADPRVRAVICISPQGPGQSGLTEQSFDQLILPYLGVTGDRDAAPAKFAAAAWHKVPFERSQPGEKYELFVHGGDETSIVSDRPVALGDSIEKLEPEGSTARHIHAATVAFWDAYLKHDIAAKRYLQSDAVQKTSHGALTLERR